MGSGCMCAPNAVIRALLRHLVVERDEVVILDMEAGVEHIGRGTASHVDALLIIADSNLKALEIAKHISDLAKKAGVKDIFLINVDVDHLIVFLGILGYIVLDGSNVMVDKMLSAGYVASKTSHPVVHDDDIGLEAMDQVI